MERVAAPTQRGNRHLRVAVLTLYTSEIEHYACLGIRNKARYCDKHDYDLIVCSRPLDPTRPPSWSKIRLLQRHLADYDWLLWTDADSLVMNPHFRLEQMTNGDAELVIGGDRNGINAGAFLIRNTLVCQQFLKRVYEQERFIHHHWWEQAAIRFLLCEDSTSIRIRPALRSELNSTPSMFQSGDFLIHFAGPCDKAAGMRQFSQIAEKATMMPSANSWPPFGQSGFRTRIRPALRKEATSR